MTVSGRPTAGDAANLRAAQDSLADLIAGDLGLAELLAQVATSAVCAVPGADGASVSLLDAADNLVAASASSAPFVTAIDEIQYAAFNEGPCITAVTERRTVCSGSLGGAKLWPRFGPRVGRSGVHSALCLPLLLDDHVVGVMGVFAYGKNVFGEDAAELAELFAKPAAVVVHNAGLLADAFALIAQLQTALSTRPVIDQAIGLIRGRSGRSSEDAFAQLCATSQTQHRKVTEVAERLVDEAVRGARARRAAS